MPLRAFVCWHQGDECVGKYLSLCVGENIACLHVGGRIAYLCVRVNCLRFCVWEGKLCVPACWSRKLRVGRDIACLCVCRGKLRVCVWLETLYVRENIACVCVHAVDA